MKRNLFLTVCSLFLLIFLFLAALTSCQKTAGESSDTSTEKPSVETTEKPVIETTEKPVDSVTPVSETVDFTVAYGGFLQSVYNAAGNPISRQHMNYDMAGEQLFNANYTYSYDEDGRLVSVYDPISTATYVLTYEQDGKTATATALVHGESDEYYATFNENGVLVSETLHKGKATEISFVFGAEGRLQKETLLVGKEKKSINYTYLDREIKGVGDDASDTDLTISMTVAGKPQEFSGVVFGEKMKMGWTYDEGERCIQYYASFVSYIDVYEVEYAEGLVNRRTVTRSDYDENHLYTCSYEYIPMDDSVTFFSKEVFLSDTPYSLETFQQYTNDGRLVQIRTVQRDEDDYVVSETQQKYDEKGFLVLSREDEYKEEGIYESGKETVYQYGENGELVKMTLNEYLHMENYPVKYTVTEYHENGYTVSVYDQQGNLKDVYQYSKDGILLH